MQRIRTALGNALIKLGRALLGGGGGPLEPLRTDPPPDQRR